METASIRCECGKLLVKRTPKGFELKCGRCKRTVFLPFPGNETHASLACRCGGIEGKGTDEGIEGRIQ